MNDASETIVTWNRPRREPGAIGVIVAVAGEC